LSRADKSLKPRQPAEILEPPREVVSIEERGYVVREGSHSRAEEPSDNRVIDRAIHPFDLVVGQRMVELREAMVDATTSRGHAPRSVTNHRAAAF
jgi:hypothetical protein